MMEDDHIVNGIHSLNNGIRNPAQTSGYECDHTKKMKLEGDKLIEWKALHKAAREIEAQSSIMTMVWKVCKCLLDETTPLIWISILLFNIKDPIDVLPYFLINVTTSLVIAYYICSEKREIVRSKQGQTNLHLVYDTSYKALTLMFDWIIEAARGDKRTQKLDIIDRNCFRDKDSPMGAEENSPFWVTTVAFREMTKFFSSNLRYMREDLLIATIRSFSLAMFTVYRITDHENMSLHICKLSDVFKLLYLLYVLGKTSFLISEFQAAERKYVSIAQLWACTETTSHTVEICHYQTIRKFEKEYLCRYFIQTMDILINFLLIAARYLAIILSMIIGYPFGGFACYFFMFFWNILLLDILNKNSQFDYQPTGYTKNKLIDRLMGTIFYNCNYSRSQLNGIFGWKTLFSIPPISILFMIIIYFKGTIYISPNVVHTFISPQIPFCSIGARNYTFINHIGDTSLDVISCIENGLRANPINVINFLGGINTCIWITFLICLPTIVLETVQKYLQRKENIDLGSFEVFPYIDACDRYRSIMKDVFEKKTNHDEFPEHAVVLTIATYGEVHIRHFIVLTILNAADFQVVWSSYRTSNDFLLTETFAQKINETINTASDNLELRNVICSDSVKTLEIESLRLVKRLRDSIHPLTRNVNNDAGLIDKFLARILDQPVQDVREIDLKLFIIFCSVLDTQLLQMSSLRLDRTCDMLRVKRSKIYEDNTI